MYKTGICGSFLSAGNLDVVGEMYDGFVIPQRRRILTIQLGHWYWGEGVHDTGWGWERMGVGIAMFSIT